MSKNITYECRELLCVYKIPDSAQLELRAARTHDRQEEAGNQCIVLLHKMWQLLAWVCRALEPLASLAPDVLFEGEAQHAQLNLLIACHNRPMNVRIF